MKRLIVAATVCFISFTSWLSESNRSYMYGPTVERHSSHVVNKTFFDIYDQTNGNVEDSAVVKPIWIDFVFVKKTQSPDSTYFNVCKITNNTQQVYEGELYVTIPPDWKLLGDINSRVKIDPGATYYLPIGAILPTTVTGGMAYPIDVTVRDKKDFFSQSCFVRIPVKSDWTMQVERNTVYFNEYFDTQPLHVHLKNKGNTSELIKLNFDVGKLLTIQGYNEEDIYYSIPPNSDTVLTFNVKRADLNPNDKASYSKIWKESLIIVYASANNSASSSESIQYRDLENVYINTRQERSSPLNVDFSIFNLLSSVQPRMNASAFGEIQFNGGHDLTYIVRARNLFQTNFNVANYYQLANSGTFNINYKYQKRFAIQLGELNNYSMHSMRGWGIKGNYNFDKNNQLSASFIVGKFYPMVGGNLRYDRRFKKISMHIGATFEDNGLLNYEAISSEIGTNFSLGKNHIFRISLLGTRSIYDQNEGLAPPNDTTVIGLSYEASYTGVQGKFRFGVNTRNDQFNNLRVRPANRISGYTRFLINQKSRINGTFQYHALKSSNLFFNNYSNGYYNGQQIYRLTYAYLFTPKLTVEAGPSARILSRFQLDSLASLSSDFTNYFYGLYALTNIRFDQFSILTPSLSAGSTFFINQLESDSVFKPMPTINAGISYMSRNWGASANYIYGPNFFLSEAFFDYDLSSFETVHLRANYNRELMIDKIMLATYLNYYLRLPANQQNLALTARFDFYFSKGLSAFLTTNVFTNSLETESNGLIARRNFSLNMGILKAFDIPQPRIKYYNYSLVCFNDLNGDGIRDQNEPLLSNIKVTFSKLNSLVEPNNIRFGEKELITDPNGKIEIINLPAGQYQLKFESLQNLGVLYNAKGDEQEIVINSDQTQYFPYVESYKVSGRVVLNRDQYSSLGLINLGGIRITATSLTGESYTALTDIDGCYSIDIPSGGNYEVKVNSIFGENFTCEKTEYTVQFDGFKSFKVDFIFNEVSRKLNLNGNEYFEFELNR